MPIGNIPADPAVSVYDQGTEYKHSFGSKTPKMPPAPPRRMTADATSTHIGLPEPELPPAAAIPKWASPLYTQKSPAGHWAPSSTDITGTTPPASFANIFMYKSIPAASLRYLNTPYLLPNDAGTGLDSRKTSAMLMHELGGANATAYLDAAEHNYSKRSGSAQSWASGQSASKGPILMPAEMYRTTTKDAFPVRSRAETQQQRMRDHNTAKHVSDHSLSSSTLLCPIAPLEDGTALHSTRFLAVRAADGGRRMIDTHATPEEPVCSAGPPVPILNRTQKSTPFVSSQPSSTYSRFHPEV